MHQIPVAIGTKKYLEDDSS